MWYFKPLNELKVFPHFVQLRTWPGTDRLADFLELAKDGFLCVIRVELPTVGNRKLPALFANTLHRKVSGLESKPNGGAIPMFIPCKI